MEMRRRRVSLLLTWVALLFLATLLWSSPGQASGGSNLLQNPGFEDGTEGWLSSASAALVVTDTVEYVHSGTWAASLKRTDGLGGEISIYQDVPVVGGGYYTLSGWVYNYKDTPVEDWAILRIEWRDSSGSLLTVDSQKLYDDEAGYQERRIPYNGGNGVQAPAAATIALIRCMAWVHDSNPPTPVFFDDLSFTLLALPTPTSTPTLTPSPTPTATPTFTPTLTPTPSPTPTATPTFTPTFTSTPTLTPTPAPSLVPLLISEVLYDGTIPQTEGDEFVEIFNPLGEAIDLAPYRLGDEESLGGGEGMYRFPEGVSISPRGTLVIAKDGGGFYERFGFYPDMEFKGSPGGGAVPDMIRDTSWGSGSWGLNNDGDEVLLLGVDSQLVDSVAYKGGDSTAVGVRGTISAPEPFSFQRVGEIDSDDMKTDFLVGVPNPGVITEFPPTPISPPEPIPLSGGMSAYFGDLHSHTTYSDGRGPPGYAYAVARANGLHFLGLSDHAYMLDEEWWEGMREEAQLATVEGAFVALEGFEWTHQEAGHINVFGSEGFISREEPEGDTLEGFYLWLASQSGAVAQFNHPGSGGDFGGFAYHPQADEVVQLLEVGNGVGSDYRRFESEYLRSLYGGWRVGVANNSDTHTLNWGVETPHRTGVVAQALSREGILAALRARRTFATEDANLALALRAGESWMGSIIPFSDTLSFTIEVADLDGEDVTLTLFDGNLAVASQGFTGAISHSWAIEVAGMAGHFYFVKAEQPDGDVGYTSPLWVAGEATPEVVFLNEVLPAPHSDDWDGDGVAGPDDEWVELFNASDSALGLGGWLLDDVADGGSAPHTILLGTVIEARGFLVLFKGETGVAFNDDGDTVRLLRPDGSLTDEFGYARNPGYDRSFSRTVDGGGTWTADYPVTMGACNLPPATPEEVPEEEPEEETPSAPPQVTVAEARVLAKGTQVVLEAQVTVAPGVFSPKTIYLQDETGGILIYLREGEYPSLKEGDWVRVQGEVWDYYGERELRVEEGNVQFLGEGEPLSPLLIATAEVNEEREGLLVEIRGLVTRVEGRSFYIDDGSGEAKVYIREATGIGESLVAVGPGITVVGVVSQYAREAPFEGGHRLLPRYEEDIKGGLVISLPVTGEEGLGLLPLILALLALFSSGVALWRRRSSLL